MVGSVDARRTISIGGGYTSGAWRYFFTYLAEDVLEDLKVKFPKVSEGKLPESQDQKPSNGRGRNHLFRHVAATVWTTTEASPNSTLIESDMLIMFLSCNGWMITG